MARRVVSVNSRIVVVMKLLYRKKRTSFLSLFESSSDRSEVVATFLAVLELMKTGEIQVYQEHTFDDIIITSDEGLRQGV